MYGEVWLEGCLSYYILMVKALYWRLALPEGFDVAGLVDEVVCRLPPSSIKPSQPLELLWETRPIVILFFPMSESLEVCVREKNELLLELLGSEVSVFINGFTSIYSRCAVSVLLPCGLPCDDGNPFMALSKWRRTHWLAQNEFDGCAVQRVEPTVRVRMVLELVTSLGPITDGTDRDRVKLMLGCVSRVDASLVQTDLQSWFEERCALGHWLVPDTDWCCWFPPGCYWRLWSNRFVSWGRATVFMMEFAPLLQSQLKFVLYFANSNMEVLNLLVQSCSQRWRDELWSVNIFSVADTSGLLSDYVSVIFAPCVGKRLLLEFFLRWEREVEPNCIRRRCVGRMHMADEIASFFDFVVKVLEVCVQRRIFRMILCQLRRRQAPVYGIKVIWRLVFEFVGFCPFPTLSRNQIVSFPT